jgi:hypothetical protein
VEDLTLGYDEEGMSAALVRFVLELAEDPFYTREEVTWILQACRENARVSAS